ncbi:ATP-binding domain-containing protein [Frankia sp. AvcI1]|nr:ATP-binding domain-containing protein [Frankia sp. AvcI1]
MAVAADVLATLRPPQQPPRSVRALGLDPWRLRVTEDELGPVLARTVLAELERLSAGQLAVLVPAGRLAELTAAVRAAVPATETGGGARLSAPVVVLGIREAKGLEFDTVLVVDPDRVLAESPRGAHDLYVALSRATRSLGVLHTGEVPAMLDRLSPAGPPADAPPAAPRSTAGRASTSPTASRAAGT